MKKNNTITVKLDKKLLREVFMHADLERSTDKLYDDHPYFKLFKNIMQQIPKKKNEERKRH